MSIMIRRCWPARTAYSVTWLLALAGVIALHPLAVAQETRAAVPEPLAISREDRLKVFEKLWETVNKEYFDPKFNGVNWAHVKVAYRPQVEAARNKEQLRVVLQTMLNELHTSHLSVGFHVQLDQQHVKQELGRKATRGENFHFDSGLDFTQVEGHFLISHVAEGSGAQLAGVQRGWILTHWNGEFFRSGLYTSCDLGKKVSLRFLDGQQERNLDVVCKLYPVPTTAPERTARRLEGGAVYLHFTEFAPGTDEWLADQVGRNRAAPAIIIDLRGNGGGRLSVLRKCFEPFFSERTIFGESRERNGKEPILKVAGRGQNAYGGRVFVLIDEMTASAAEIFAAGLQESGRAKVIGHQSSGEVLNNIEQGLPNGFKAKIAIRDYETAKGIRLEGRGVIPDEEVKLTMRAFMENHDPDLDRVCELLQKQSAGTSTH